MGKHLAESARSEFHESPIRTSAALIGALAVVAGAVWQGRTIVFGYIAPTLYCILVVYHHISSEIYWASRRASPYYWGSKIRRAVLTTGFFTLFVILALQMSVRKMASKILVVVPASEERDKLLADVAFDVPIVYWTLLALVTAHVLLLVAFGGAGYLRRQRELDSSPDSDNENAGGSDGE